MNNQAPILTLRGVQKKYGDNLVLNDLDLEIHPGRFYALLGRNGTGKSTLMRLLMRHEPYDRGNGTAFGMDMASDSALFNENMGFVSENVSFHFQSLSVEGILAFQKSLRPRWDDGYVNEALSILNLPCSSAFGSLSRGQKMQVVFVCATAFWPKLLLLDEITSVLDLVARDYFLRRLDRYVDEGGTVIAATNIISEVQHVLDHVILLHGGRARFNASIQELCPKFRKLAKPKGVSNEIFVNRECAEVGLNSNGQALYLAPADLLDGREELRAFQEGEPTIQDVFLYMCKVRE